MRAAIDLTEVAHKLDKLGNKQKFRPVISAIKRYQSAWSIWVDLSTSKKALEAIEDIQDIDPLRQSFADALMTQAIMMYSRAAIAKQDGRNAVEVRQKLPPDLAKTHHEIDALRDTVTAHYGVPSGHYAQQWANERLVTKITPDGKNETVFVFNRANYLADLANDMYQLVLAALDIVWSELTVRKAKMNGCLESAMDVELSRIIFATRFDPRSIYRSEQHIEEFWRAHDSASLQIFPDREPEISA